MNDQLTPKEVKMTLKKTDTELVAYCGLYCGACSKYLKGSCPGCHANEKATWCGVRTCNMENKYQSCAECKEFSDPMACKKYNNFMAKLFGFIFRSNRAACIEQIRQVGIDEHAKKMAESGMPSIKR